MKKLRCSRHNLTLEVLAPNEWRADVDRGAGWPSACGLLTNPEKRAGELAVYDQAGRPTQRTCTVTEVR